MSKRRTACRRAGLVTAELSQTQLVALEVDQDGHTSDMMAFVELLS